MQKIALTKFLLAIVQAAFREGLTESRWLEIGPTAMARTVLEYLRSSRGYFNLFGPSPCLQFPRAGDSLKSNPCGAFVPGIAAGNTAVITSSQIGRPLTNADKALLVVQLSGFALGGKKGDNSVAFSKGYEKKAGSAPGPALGPYGLLHSIVVGPTLWDTLWLNALSSEAIEELFPAGLGPIPWETPLEGEDCKTAQALRGSLMGSLLPMSRLCLLESATGQGIFVGEGVRHPGYKDGRVDPSVFLDTRKKVVKSLWADPSRRPWRSLAQILGHLAGIPGLSVPSVARAFPQQGLPRYRHLGLPVFLWAGGIQVSYSTGEQFLSGGNGYVEQLVPLPSDLSPKWYSTLSSKFDTLAAISSQLWGASLGYYKDIGADPNTSKALAGKVGDAFWDALEYLVPELLSAQDSLPEGVSSILYTIFDTYCTNDGTRQSLAWAKNRPRSITVAAKTKGAGDELDK